MRVVFFCVPGKEMTICNIVFHYSPNPRRIYCCEFSFRAACMRIPLLLATTFLCVLAIPASAQTHFEIAAGVSLTRDNEDTQAAAIAWLPPWRDEVYGGALRGDIGAIYLRGRAHSRYNNAATVRLVHAGLRYERRNGLTAGFGIGVQHGKTDALSGDPQFISSIGWRWERVSLLFRHISNAGLHNPNEGENILQLGWQF